MLSVFVGQVMYRSDQMNFGRTEWLVGLCSHRTLELEQGAALVIQQGASLGDLASKQASALTQQYVQHMPGSRVQCHCSHANLVSLAW